MKTVPAIALAAVLAAMTFLSAAPSLLGAALEITGAGATFPYPIYAKWADAYKKEAGTVLTYQPIGSGGGIRPSAHRTCRSSSISSTRMASFNFPP